MVLQPLAPRDSSSPETPGADLITGNSAEVSARAESYDPWLDVEETAAPAAGAFAGLNGIKMPADAAWPAPAAAAAVAGPISATATGAAAAAVSLPRAIAATLAPAASVVAAAVVPPAELDRYTAATSPSEAAAATAALGQHATAAAHSNTAAECRNTHSGTSDNNRGNIYNSGSNSGSVGAGVAREMNNDDEEEEEAAPPPPSDTEFSEPEFSLGF